MVIVPHFNWPAAIMSVEEERKQSFMVYKMRNVSSLANKGFSSRGREEMDGTVNELWIGGLFLQQCYPVCREHSKRNDSATKSHV